MRLHYSFTAYQKSRIESKCSIYIISDATVEFKHCIEENWGRWSSIFVVPAINWNGWDYSPVCKILILACHL